MKGFKFIIGIIATFLLFSILFFIFEFRENVRLKKELAEKTQKVREIKEAKEEVDSLQKEIIGLKLEAVQIERKIPYNEDQPLKLIRKLILLGSKRDLKNLEIFPGEGEKEGPAQAPGSPDSGGMGMAPPSGVGEAPESTSPSQAGQPSQSPLSSTTNLEVKPLAIKMTFECEFSHLVSFLREILNLERLVSVEEIKIERSEKILPYQKVTLKLVTYTFLAD